MDGRINNVFISHIHEDDDRLGALKDLLAKNGRTVRDSSINSAKPNQAKDPDYIKNGILKPAIDWAGALIVLITPETCDSEWVDWEIQYAHEQGKCIIGVWDHGEAECERPENLDKYANAIVGWQGEVIIDALDGKITDICEPDNSTRPERDIARYGCPG